MKCRLGRIRRWLHGLLGWSTYVALALLVISVTAVAALRWVDPPTSACIERYVWQSSGPTSRTVVRASGG